ncbi:MAG: hypothetical protein R6X34_13210, partial [Chloroflexota bacterium]
FDQYAEQHYRNREFPALVGDELRPPDTMSMAVSETSIAAAATNIIIVSVIALFLRMSLRIVM